VSQDLSDDRVIKALAHPTRRKILLEFDDAGVASPKEIAKRLALPLPNVSYHVTILRKLGLIELKGTTPRRGVVEHHYAARPRRQVSPSGLSRLPAQARNVATRAAWRELAPVLEDQGASVVARRMKLDDRGARAVERAMEKLWLELDRIGTAAEKRIGQLEGDGPTELVVGVICGAPAAKRPRAKVSKRAS
jgi:DNA-binding transcriptional ArsR family regulator